MYYLLPLLLIAFVYILPSHWQKLKLKRDKILTITFLLLFAVIILMYFFMPKVRRSVWEGRFIIIGLVILLFMIFIAIAEFLSLKRPSTRDKTIVFIAAGIPIIILIILGFFVAWNYYTRYLPSLER